MEKDKIRSIYFVDGNSYSNVTAFKPADKNDDS